MENSEKINWGNLNEEKAKFIFEQAKEYLEKTLYVSDQLQNKAAILLGFGVTLMNGLVAYVIINENVFGLLWPVGLYIIALLVCNIYCIRVLLPTDYHGTGNLPERFLNDRVLQQNIDKITIGESENYTERAELNKKQNRRKAENLRIGIYIFTFAPILVGIIMIGPLISQIFKCLF